MPGPQACCSVRARERAAARFPAEGGEEVAGDAPGQQGGVLYAPPTGVPISVEKEVSGRLPVDESEQLYEQLVTAAKSVNHHLKAGDGVPAHTTENLNKVTGRLESLAPELAGETEEAMAAHYQAAAAAMAERLAPGYDVPYDRGGRVPQVTPFEAAGNVTFTRVRPRLGRGEAGRPDAKRHSHRSCGRRRRRCPLGRQGPLQGQRQGVRRRPRRRLTRLRRHARDHQ